MPTIESQLLLASGFTFKPTAQESRKALHDTAQLISGELDDRAAGGAASAHRGAVARALEALQHAIEKSDAKSIADIARELERLAK